jgi:hypothetical protein
VAAGGGHRKEDASSRVAQRETRVPDMKLTLE